MGTVCKVNQYQSASWNFRIVIVTHNLNELLEEEL
jgi:hypothetical protein